MSPENANRSFDCGRNAQVTPRSSVGFRQTERALGDIAKDQFAADRRYSGDENLAQIPLDVILLGVAHAAMRHDRGLAGVESSFTGEILG